METPIIQSTPTQVDNICYVCPDTPVTFNIVSSLTPGASYQWYLNDVLVSVGTSYTLANPSTSDIVYVKEIVTVVQCNNYRTVDNTNAPSKNNVGTLRYRLASANSSVCEMVMQTGEYSYDWVVIKTTTW